MEKPICPKCKVSYPINTLFCAIDGVKLVSEKDLIPKCIICETPYSENVKFCTKDGGEVKVILKNQSNNTQYISGKIKTYIKASLSNRILAALLDGIITLGLSIPAIILFLIGTERMETHYYNDSGFTFITIACFLYLIPLTYSLLKDGLANGQSIGKKVFNLMVVNLENNTSCDKGKSFLRNFISGILIIIPFIGVLIELILVLTSEDGRKLGDKVANTQVIDETIK
jgi:uncharacterized RDD family membrane protein YckC